MQAETGSDINRAKHELRKGNLVAIPTETVYGLAANGLDEQAITTIFLAKNRPQFNPLILHVCDKVAARKLTISWPEKAESLADAFWPGPLTLLLTKNAQIPDLITAGSPLVAIRVPSHPLTQSLLQAIDFPLAAPSANPSGYISPTTARHVQQQLGDRIAYILDGGEAGVGIESTIIGFNKQGNALLYRLGGLSLEAIEEVVGPVATAQKEHHKPATPGRLERHYAPETSFVISTRTDDLQQFKGKKIGALTFCEPWPEIDTDRQLLLSKEGDTSEAARNLFRMMRELDAMDLDLIVTELLPNEGLGPAINDRLRRASYDSRVD